MPQCQACGCGISESNDVCPDCGEEIKQVSSGNQEGKHKHPGEDGVAWKHLLKVIPMALVLSILVGAIIPGNNSGFGFLIGIPVFSYLGYQRPTTKTAFGRVSFWAATSLFMWPLLQILYALLQISYITLVGPINDFSLLGEGSKVIAAFVIGFPLGMLFYLLSRRYNLKETE